MSAVLMANLIVWFLFYSLLLKAHQFNVAAPVVLHRENLVCLCLLMATELLGILSFHLQQQYFHTLRQLSTGHSVNKALQFVTEAKVLSSI